jgi:hypothetical protein
LRGRLIDEGFSIWQDIITLEGGRDWWSQIEDALKSKELQHFVFVVTPAALASPVVRREIRLARQEGKTVCSIKGPELSDLAQLPRWLDVGPSQVTQYRAFLSYSRRDDDWGR